MRIGIDARFYGSLGKGLGRYTEKLIEHLELIDHDNEYVVFLRPENYEEYVPKNARFRKEVVRYAWYGVAEQTLFVVTLYRGKFDLVHFLHFNVPLLYRKRFVVTIHDLILLHYPTLRNTTRFSFMYWFKFLLYRVVIASAIRRAAHIIAVSHFTKEDIIKQYREARGKVAVTYEAADPFCQWSSFTEERLLFTRLGLVKASHSEHEKGGYHDILQSYFLYVGNAYPHKNLAIFFALAEAMPSHVLVLVGKEDFFYARLKKEAQKRQIHNIIFAGFVTDRELASLYRYAQLYIFPSLYEGFGLPPLEAMTRGTPVISSNRGSLPEILGNAALYFDPTSSSDLIALVQKVEGDAHLKQDMKERGYRQAAQFSFSGMAFLTRQVYQVATKNKTYSHGLSSTDTTE